MHAPREAIAALQGLEPFDFAELSDKLSELERQRNAAWDRVVAEAKPHHAALKKYVRQKLRLGKGQSIAFHGNGVVAIFKHRERQRVACIDATIRTGIGGVDIKLHWLPEDLGDLDRRIAAVRDALATIRMAYRDLSRNLSGICPESVWNLSEILRMP